MNERARPSVCLAESANRIRRQPRSRGSLATATDIAFASRSARSCDYGVGSRARLESVDGGTSEWKSKTLSTYRRRTKEVDALIADSYLAGTNTRRAGRALAALFAGSVSKDTVSRVWRKIKRDWEAWNKRDLRSDDMVRLILGGTPVRVLPLCTHSSAMPLLAGWHSEWPIYNSRRVTGRRVGPCGEEHSYVLIAAAPEDRLHRPLPDAHLGSRPTSKRWSKRSMAWFARARFCISGSPTCRPGAGQSLLLHLPHRPRPLHQRAEPLQFDLARGRARAVAVLPGRRVSASSPIARWRGASSQVLGAATGWHP
jgi:Transposase, Mutator family